MEAILEETGIAKRTLYRWWPNKSALVAEAVLGGFVAVPETRVAHSDDVWADLRDWLESIAGAVRGPYGEVLRAAVAIGASDAALADSMERVFAAPARANITHRLELAIRDRQVTPVADLDTVVDLLMAIIVFAGVSRGEPERLSATLGLIRSGLSI
jgi:AcrR family transcriptional regulator